MDFVEQGVLEIDCVYIDGFLCLPLRFLTASKEDRIPLEITLEIPGLHMRESCCSRNCVNVKIFITFLTPEGPG